MSQVNQSKIIADFRSSNRKLYNELAKLPQEELLERLVVELAEKQHRRTADLDRVKNAIQESPNILRVLKNAPNDKE